MPAKGTYSVQPDSRRFIQITLRNGSRPKKTYDTKAELMKWVGKQRAQDQLEKEPVEHAAVIALDLKRRVAEIGMTKLLDVCVD